jgi:hypothetical protein
MSKDTKNRATYNVLIPEKVIPEFEKFENNPPDIPGFRMSSFEQLAYLICKRQEEDGCAYLNMAVLREQIPQAEYYVKALLNPENPIIERTNYIPGEHSYGYKFTPEYDSDYISKPVTDMKLIHRLGEMRERFAIGFGVQNKFIKNFTVDPLALEFAKTNYSGDKLKYAQASITSMENPFERYSMVDSAGGRFYSNATNCKKGLRQFINVDGEYLKYNTDISNSQPYFSTMIFNRPNEVAKYAKDKELASCIRNLDVPIKKDVELYCDLVTAGKFYEYLVPHFEERGLIDSLLSHKEKRDYVKKEILKIIYDRNRPHLTKSKQIFKDEFPTIHNTFAIIRGDGRGERFPILLQALEAHVVLKNIYTVVINELKDTVFFTVHDSFLVSRNQDAVKGVMIEELKQFTGYSPQIKVEKLAEQR